MKSIGILLSLAFVAPALAGLESSPRRLDYTRPPPHFESIVRRWKAEHPRRKELYVTHPAFDPTPPGEIRADGVDRVVFARTASGEQMERGRFEFGGKRYVIANFGSAREQVDADDWKRARDAATDRPVRGRLAGAKKRIVELYRDARHTLAVMAAQTYESERGPEFADAQGGTQLEFDGSPPFPRWLFSEFHYPELHQGSLMHLTHEELKAFVTLPKWRKYHATLDGKWGPGELPLWLWDDLEAQETELLVLIEDPPARPLSKLSRPELRRLLREHALASFQLSLTPDWIHHDGYPTSSRRVYVSDAKRFPHTLESLQSGPPETLAEARRALDQRRIAVAGRNVHYARRVPPELSALFNLHVMDVAVGREQPVQSLVFGWRDSMKRLNSFLPVELLGPLQEPGIKPERAYYLDLTPDTIAAIREKLRPAALLADPDYRSTDPEQRGAKAPGPRFLERDYFGG